MFSLALNWLPSASTSGDRFDLFMLTATVIGTVMFVGTIGAAIYWAIIYRRKREGEETPFIPGNYLVEFVSVFGIAIWVAIFFLWGWRDYHYTITPKADEYEISSGTGRSSTPTAKLSRTSSWLPAVFPPASS